MLQVEVLPLLHLAKSRHKAVESQLEPNLVGD